MTPCTSTAVPRPALPALVDVRYRWTELLGSDLDHQPEDAASSAAPTLTPALIEDSVWPSLAAPALYGLPGAVVRTIAPHTEADPAAILLQFLAAFGNLVGPATFSAFSAYSAYSALLFGRTQQSLAESGGLSAPGALIAHTFFRVAEAQTCSPGNWS